MAEILDPDALERVATLEAQAQSLPSGDAFEPIRVGEKAKKP